MTAKAFPSLTNTEIVSINLIGFRCKSLTVITQNVFPADKTEITGYSFEPWHVRYVGVENARRIHENEMPLETYLLLVRQETLMDIVLGEEAAP